MDDARRLLLQLVAQLSGLLRHEIMDFMFADPTMLDDLDFLYKSDTARKLMFYYQVEEAAEGASAETAGQAGAGAPSGAERATKASKKSIRDGEIVQKTSLHSKEPSRFCRFLYIL